MKKSKKELQNKTPGSKNNSSQRKDYFNSNNKRAIFNQFYPRIKKRTISPVYIKMRNE
jgi:hypothetical protein